MRGDVEIHCALLSRIPLKRALVQTENFLHILRFGKSNIANIEQKTEKIATRKTIVIIPDKNLSAVIFPGFESDFMKQFCAVCFCYVFKYAY